jgi:hypothetical protein
MSKQEAFELLRVLTPIIVPIVVALIGLIGVFRNNKRK